MRFTPVLLVVAVLCAACGGDTATTLDPTLPPTSRPAPADRPVSTPAPTTPAPVAESTAPTVTGAGTGPVVDLFYAVHVHAHNEWSPYRDPGMTELDVAAAEGYITQVDTIAGTLEAHGARGSFHFTFGTATGLCVHDPGFFDGLEARGHEIGIHAHSDAFLLQAAEAMQTACGRPIATGSGLAAMAGGPDGSTAQSLAASLAVFEAVGAEQLLVNMSDWCRTASAAGNDPTPWHAAGDDICADSPGGIVMIDQTPLEYVLTDGAPADVFSASEFEILAGLAEMAIAQAGSSPIDGPVVWGFVTHTGEYVVGNTAIARPQDSAVDGLDLLLSRLDPYVDSGLARWSTGAEIASRMP